jgi:two-component system, NtrC family, nitrogen regulation sensor histidine kinase NtrY
MRFGLRARLTAAFVFGALVPMVAVGLWARGVMVDLAEREHERAVAATVVSARDRIAGKLERHRAALVQACARDRGLWGLAGGLPDAAPPTSTRAFREQAEALRRTLGVDRAEIWWMPPKGGAGALLGASPSPSGRKANAVGKALGREDFHVEGVDGTPTLLAACATEAGTGRLAVLVERGLNEAFLRDVLGDLMAVRLEPIGAAASVAPRWRSVHTFVNAQGAPAVRAVAAVDDGELAAERARLDRGFAVTGVLALLLALTLGLAIGMATTRPLSTLESAARRVGGGDLESTIDGVGSGEVGDALDAFNRMTRELKRTRAKLLRAERIAAWRDIARRIAHEIKNPLLPIQVSIETMRKTYAKRHPDFDEIFEESTLAILEEVERLKRIVQEFSRFARMPRPEPRPMQVGEVAEHVVALHRDGAVPVRLGVEPAPVVLADREQITQVLTNLVQNAVDACAQGDAAAGEVRVRVGPSARGAGVDLIVEDDGPGIPEAERDRVFEPYYTTKVGGTGLGLAIVHRIVLDHGGDIDVETSTTGGARFRVWLRPEGPPLEAEASMTDAALPLVTRRDR